MVCTSWFGTAPVRRLPSRQSALAPRLPPFPWLTMREGPSGGKSLNSAAQERSRLSGRQATPTHQSQRSAEVRLRSRPAVFRRESCPCQRLAARAPAHFRHEPRPPGQLPRAAHFRPAPRPPREDCRCQSVYGRAAAKRWSAAAERLVFRIRGLPGVKYALGAGSAVGGEMCVLTLHPRLTWNSRASFCPSSSSELGYSRGSPRPAL